MKTIFFLNAKNLAKMWKLRKINPMIWRHIISVLRHSWLIKGPCGSAGHPFTLRCFTGNCIQPMPLFFCALEPSSALVCSWNTCSHCLFNMLSCTNTIKQKRDRQRSKPKKDLAEWHLACRKIDVWTAMRCVSANSTFSFGFPANSSLIDWNLFSSQLSFYFTAFARRPQVH